MRFSQASPAVRREVLTAWRTPTVLVRRVAADALMMVMGMAYFRHPEVQAAMGYRAACGGVHV